MKLFYAAEFTGLHKNTTLISLGVIDENGRSFYAVCTDYDTTQVDSWLQSNVLDKLYEYDAPVVVGTRAEVKAALLEFLQDYESMHFVGDCISFGWVVFCDLFGGSMELPENISYMPMDICTMFYMKGLDPLSPREAFCGHTACTHLKHNALYDASIIRHSFFELLKHPSLY